jgi:hypothetical protein
VGQREGTDESLQRASGCREQTQGTAFRLQHLQAAIHHLRKTLLFFLNYPEHVGEYLARELMLLALLRELLEHMNRSGEEV